MIAPPLYRSQPHWYSRNLAQVASRFSATLSSTKPPNLDLLPSFCSQDLLPDGAFLTPVSGLHYILHLFDQSNALLDLVSAPPAVQSGAAQETVRRHDDRLAYLESSHGHLVKRVDLKTAADADFDDMVVNRSEEDWLTILGLKRLKSSHEEWQNDARRQVRDVINLILKTTKTHLEYKVLYVGCPVRFRANGQNVYNVQMDSVHSSKRIRDLFSGFFRHHRPVECPASLKTLNVRNKVTIATRVRISILQQLGANYKEKNPGSSIRVKGYRPRPTLTIIPPRGTSGSGSASRPTLTTSLKPFQPSQPHCQMTTWPRSSRFSVLITKASSGPSLSFSVMMIVSVA